MFLISSSNEVSTAVDDGRALLRVAILKNHQNENKESNDHVRTHR